MISLFISYLLKSIFKCIIIKIKKDLNEYLCICTFAVILNCMNHN